MQIIKNNLLLMAAILFFPTVIFASDPKLTEPPATTQKSVNSYIFKGYIDGSFNYLVRSNHFISYVHDRVFDIEPNGFTLQQAGITLAKQPPQGFGGLLHAVVGRDAITLAPYGFSPSFGISKTFGYDIPQAFVQYAGGSWITMIGQFYSQAGYESDDPTLNTNYSRSILSGYIEPGSMLGGRSTYNINEKINVYAGVNNGWDNIADWSRNKTIELGMTYSIPEVSFSAVMYSGDQRAEPRASSGPVGRRTIVDWYVLYNMTKKLSFVVNYDFVWQTKAELVNDTFAKAIAHGLAGYINYQWTNKWQTSFRGEYLYDQNGFATGVRQSWREVTFTVAYIPVKNFQLHFETRHDFSNVNAFLNKNGRTVSNNNQSFAVEGLFKF